MFLGSNEKIQQSIRKCEAEINCKFLSHFIKLITILSVCVCVFDTKKQIPP